MNSDQIDSSKNTKTCVLKGIYETDSLLYQTIYQQLHAPAWAGYNLDALFDILTAEIKGPVRVEWHGFGHMEKQHQKLNLQISSIFEEVAQERADFSFIKHK